MKQNLRSWNFIPRAVIFFCILLNSIENSIATNQELKEELRGIHQEISSLRNENHQQNMEIALLKEIAGLQDILPNHQKVKKEQPNDLTINKLSTRTGNDRQKRPYRLLPPLNDKLDGDGKRKGATISPNQQFYGPPTGCSDLVLLGFTLNGFYQVISNQSKTNSIEINNSTKLETVFCAFKQPQGKFNPALVEKRIISRRETKPSSGIVLYFHGTRKTDLEVSRDNQFFTIKFDKVNVNLDNAFDPTKGTFTVQKSGVYLLIFRGRVTFPQVFVSNGSPLGWIYYAKNGKFFGRDSIDLENNLNKSTNVELDKLIKLNREDKIVVGLKFHQYDVKNVLANSTSFAVYLLEE